MRLESSKQKSYEPHDGSFSVEERLEQFTVEVASKSIPPIEYSGRIVPFMDVIEKAKKSDLEASFLLAQELNHGNKLTKSPELGLRLLERAINKYMKDTSEGVPLQTSILYAKYLINNGETKKAVKLLKSLDDYGCPAAAYFLSEAEKKKSPKIINEQYEQYLIRAVKLGHVWSRTKYGRYLVSKPALRDKFSGLLIMLSNWPRVAKLSLRKSRGTLSGDQFY